MIKFYLQEALRNLLSTKLRSLLATLGILVGTASVVAMVSSGEMATQQALAQFKRLGTNLMAVTLMPKRAHKGTFFHDTLPLASATQLPQQLNSLKNVAPYINTFAHVSFNGHPIRNNIVGATQSLQPLLKLNLEKGRFINDLDGYHYFCVLGDNVLQRLRPLLGGRNPLGQNLRVDHAFFTVVGILKPVVSNVFFNQDLNDSVIIPLKTASILNKYAQINNLLLQLTEGVNIDQTQSLLEQALQPAVPHTSLYFRSAKQLIENMHAQSHIYTWLLALIGSISLLVGGIGVMNIMLVSVTERKREIGIRLAVGAKRRDIQALFLMESIVLTLCGGFLGIFVGLFITAIIAKIAGWHFAIFWTPLAAGFFVSLATGIFFGFYPAKQAAKLDPIQALRTE